MRGESVLHEGPHGGLGVPVGSPTGVGSRQWN